MKSVSLILCRLKYNQNFISDIIILKSIVLHLLTTTLSNGERFTRHSSAPVVLAYLDYK